MNDFDAASIVPSTRDLLRVLATRRRSLAIVGVLEEAGAVEDSKRLDELGVSAFACASLAASRAAASATKTVPVLAITDARVRDEALAARFFGADGLSVAADLDESAWDAVATAARTTRLLPVAVAGSSAEFSRALATGARAVLLRAADAGALLALAEGAPPNLTLVAHADGAELEELRALKGRVDALIVPSRLHRSRDFAGFVSDVDP